MINKPLIVHNDGRLFLIQKYDEHYHVEDQVNTFATLQKALSNIHTYRLDKYSLWSAAFLGVKALEIIDILDDYSINIIPEKIKNFIKSELESFWTMELYIENDIVRLKGNADAIKKILAIEALEKMIEAREKDALYFKISNLYNLRLELIKTNVFLKEMNDGVGYTDLKLNLDIKLYNYQKLAVKKFIGEDKNHINGRGLIIMPPGSGKTMVALKIIEELGVRTLIIVPDKKIYEDIWLVEIEKNTNYEEKDVSYNSFEDKTITFYSYIEAARKLSKPNDKWGLIIYDKAFRLAADLSRETAFISSKYKLALDSTIARGNTDDMSIYRAIGPKVIDLPLKKLEENYQIKVKCTEIKIPYVPWTDKSEKSGFHTISKNIKKVEALKYILKLHPDNNFVLASYYRSVAKKISEELKIKDISTGEPKNDKRDILLRKFNNNETKIVIITEIIEDMALENIDILVSLSYRQGSKREEYKRIGKLKSSNTWSKKIGYYYALVATGTEEEKKYRVRRNEMINQGYDFSILPLKKLRSKAYEI
ncbi:MAG: helicase-associated domain-containing protein [bacterium]